MIKRRFSALPLSDFLSAKPSQLGAPFRIRGILHDAGRVASASRRNY
jgi:hypothetical protein